MSRIAGAPISWGVCEVPGWGPMMDPPRVLREMISLGLKDTEQGSPGFFPDDINEFKKLIDEYDVNVIAHFVPLALHDTAQQASQLAEAEATAARLEQLGAQVFVTCAVADPDWSNPYRMDDSELKVLAENFKRVDEICAAHGLIQAVHPHLGSMVEKKEDVQRTADASDVKWTIDTGHLTMGGYDPADFASDLGDRVAHAHLKDANLGLVDKVMSRELTLKQATEQGAFLPFGKGDVDVAGIVRQLESSGYKGWYVLECDTSIQGEIPSEGTGPVEDMKICVDYMNEEFPQGL